MAKQAVGIGSSANDGTGDTLRVGADKINDNFDEIYALLNKFKVSYKVNNPNQLANKVDKMLKEKNNFNIVLFTQFKYGRHMLMFTILPKE